MSRKNGTTATIFVLALLVSMFLTPIATATYKEQIENTVDNAGLVGATTRSTRVVVLRYRFIATPMKQHATLAHSVAFYVNNGNIDSSTLEGGFAVVAIMDPSYSVSVFDISRLVNNNRAYSVVDGAHHFDATTVPYQWGISSDATGTSVGEW